MQIHRLLFRVRRPLALCCLAFLLCLLLLVLICPPGDEPLPFADREQITAAGILVRKDTAADAEGAPVPVYTIRTDAEKPLILQCYMDTAHLPAKEVSVGARVLIQGDVRCFTHATNPGEFDTADYYRVIGISCRLYNAVIVKEDGGGSVIRECLHQLRCRFADALDRSLPAEDAGILRAMLLGDKSALDRDTKQLYQRSGIIHILAISGLHISVIGMGLYRLLTRCFLPRPAAAFTAVLFMMAYGEMCGSTSSTVRAIVMFGLHLLAVVLGRSYDLLTALAVAALLLAVDEPLVLTYSGFLFSFLAVLGVGALLPALQPDALALRVPERGEKRTVKMAYTALNGVMASLSVSLLTLPVYMVSYHTFPVYSVLLNVLILPLMSVVLPAGLLCMFLGLFSGFLGQMAGVPDRVLLAVFRRLCLAENAFPGAVWVTGHAHVLQVALYYLLLALFVCAVFFLRERERYRKKPRRPKNGRQIVARILYLGAAVLLLSIRFRPALKIAVLDVGQGDGIVIEGGGMCLMIDGGSSSRSGIGNRVLEPYLAYEGIAHVDAAVLTHEDEDHMNGLLELLEEENPSVRIDRLVLPAASAAGRGDNRLRLEQAAEKRGIAITEIAGGDTLTEGALLIRCLGPPRDRTFDEPNEASTVLYLEFGDCTALFTGDLEGAGEEALMERLARDGQVSDHVTLLKAAHHGSRYSTGEALVERLHPCVAFVSCGRNNRYGHPHRELLERLYNSGTAIHVTAGEGALFLESDGRTVRTYAAGAGAGSKR